MSSMSWTFDYSGEYDFPLLVLDSNFRYVICGRNEGGDVKFFKCINWGRGCPSTAAVGSTYHEEGGGEGWGYITQYLLDFSPLNTHICSDETSVELTSFTSDIQSLELMFDNVNIKR